MPWWNISIMQPLYSVLKLSTATQYTLLTMMNVWTCISVFPTGVMGERWGPPPPAEHFLIPLFQQISLPNQIFISPLPKVHPSKLNNTSHVILNKNFTFSYIHCCIYYFCFNFIIFVHSDHSNFDFNGYEIFTECCF